MSSEFIADSNGSTGKIGGDYYGVVAAKQRLRIGRYPRSLPPSKPECQRLSNQSI